MIDLHTHTTASDGSLTPTELILKSIEIGLSAIAITDHDTLDGIEEGERASKEFGITFVPGVEIEIQYPYTGEFHLLGLGLKRIDSELYRTLLELQKYREIRNHEIISLMNKINIDVNYDDVKKYAGGDIIARPHFAQLLVDRKIVRNKEDAFKNYLNPGKPLYMPKKSLELSEAIKLIHLAGGKAIIAHPQSLYISWKKLPEILKNFKTLGLDGIEAWHGGNNSSECTKFEKIASDLRLIVSGGSDYHGNNIDNRTLGFGAGQRRVPDILLNKILED